MTIAGTSTMHDWESDVETITGSASIALEEGALSISQLKFSAVVQSIKSGKGGMDSKTYEALKEKEHPKIMYVFSEAQQAGNTLRTTGNLTIAGKTNAAKMDANYTINDDGSITLEGSHQVKMTEFDIKPPTAMLGTIKTGDEITISYVVVFRK